MVKNKIVSILNTTPNTLKKDIEKIFKISNFNKLDSNKLTLIKINGNCNKYYPGSNTSPWFLDALLSILKKKGFKKIKIIEGDLYEFKVEDMLIKTHLGEVANKHKIKCLNYEKLPRNNILIPKILENTQIINTPVLHTHGFAKISCATKNMWGFLPVTRRHLHKELNKRLLQMYEKIPMYTIADGTVGMYGDSTRTGLPKEINLLLAGWDTLTIDHAVAQILGFSPNEIPLIVDAEKQKKLKKYTINGDYNLKNLPKHNFQYVDTLERKITRWLECLENPNPINKITGYILHTPVIDFFYNRIRMIYNNVQYAKKINQILKGNWNKYEKNTPYINYKNE